MFRSNAKKHLFLTMPVFYVVEELGSFSCKILWSIWCKIKPILPIYKQCIIRRRKRKRGRRRKGREWRRRGRKEKKDEEEEMEEKKVYL